jgi:Ca2+-binding EF-hand superfamily protein
MFTKIDADKSGSLSESEFVSARPKHMDEEQATAAYAALDSEDTGSVSFEQFSAASEHPESRISGEAMGALMGMGPQGGMMPPGGMHGGPTDPSELYANIDADSDGKVTEEEFVTSAPDHMSADDASELYASIDTENAGYITEDQFAESLRDQHGGPGMGGPGMGGMPPMMGGARSATDEAA